MKKIILSFDGPDNVGKGTQIEKIRKYFKNIPFVILHVTAPVGGTFEEKIKYGSSSEEEYFKARTSLWEKNIPQINDRAHYSEYAYRMFRGSDKIDDILEMEKRYSKIIEDSLIFTFVDEAENIAARDDGLSMYQKDEIQKIQELVGRFKYIAEKSIFDNTVIDINGKDKDEVFALVLKKIKDKFNI